MYNDVRSIWKGQTAEARDTWYKCLEDIFKERLGIRRNKADEKLKTRGETAMPYNGDSDADEEDEVGQRASLQGRWDTVVLRGKLNLA